MGYYYHVRGMWDKKLILHPIAAEIARRHRDRIEESARWTRWSRC